MPVDAPISAAEARALFVAFARAPAVLLAVSGGPDSMALLWLMARWRRARKTGPTLHAVTVDHGLRKESAAEARAVARLAAELGVPHRTLRWRGAKPATGLPAAARDARYALLAQAARAAGASDVLTGHTRDDQAETVLMRMARGSGLTGLAAMTGQTERDGIRIARPLLQVSKTALVATLDRAKIAYAVDPSNTDPTFTRPRLRALMPHLAAEGLGPHALARLAARMARADAALNLMADGAERYLALTGPGRVPEAIDAVVFAGLAEEIRVRLLLRLIDRVGHEGPAELGKVETLVQAMEQALKAGGNGILLKQTLAGAVIALTSDRLKIVPAPPRRAAKRAQLRTGP